jgi:hypothetical protein
LDLRHLFGLDFCQRSSMPAAPTFLADEPLNLELVDGTSYRLLKSIATPDRGPG